MITHKDFQQGETNEDGNECWGCGHWLIGGGCWKNGQMGTTGWFATNPDDSCAEWVEENTVGTITGEIQKHITEEQAYGTDCRIGGGCE
jgi:hypothetical protein